jgi:TM2 domain-containing membrane protein YozV
MDVVYLKDGSIIKGTIIEQIPNVSIKIETIDGSVFVYKMEQIEKITKEEKRVAAETSGNSRENSRHIRKKSPVLAFWLSFLVPGAGQYYNGQITKGIIQDVLYVAGLTVALTAGIKTETTPYYSYGYYYSYYYDETTKSITAWYWIGLGVAIGSWVWSMIDAPISASAINREASSHSYGHLFEYDFNQNTAVGLDPAVLRNGNGASLTIHF